MEIRYPEIGICGLSCTLCPSYHSKAASRCRGCKSPGRMAAGCPFITCAIKKMGVGFCWDCGKNGSCEKWTSHREAGKVRDSFKCYQKLEDDIDFIKKHGVQAFDEQQKTRESLLTALLDRFNEGRSKSYYCIAATVFDTYELSNALEEGVSTSKSMGIKDKSRNMHAILERIALKKGYVLSLRK